MSIKIIAGDCRDVLAAMPAESVHMVCTSPPYYGLRSYLDAGHVDKQREIGSEATPEAYLETMVAVFRDVRRVLRPDGTLWLNVGDSYNAGTSAKRRAPAVGTVDVGGWQDAEIDGGARIGVAGLAPKQLLMMPARLALALQADGWWLRSDIIWHKPNPMPESVTDRPTSAHEHVFLLTKSARYFYDAEAVREEELVPGASAKQIEYQQRQRNARIKPDGVNHSLEWRGGDDSYKGGRNLRNVWTIATHAFSAAHFATYPPELVERCIRAGTSERGCCAQCGAPWRRVVERVNGNAGKSWHNHEADDVRGQRGGASAYHGAERKAYEANGVTTTGWTPSCTHGGDPVPCTVLDCFAGAGTSLLVADRLQRDAIGIDLNPDYNAMSRARIEADAPLFAAFPVTDPADERQADLWQEPVAK